MYVVYSNCLYFLSIFLFTYNKNLLPPPPPKKKNSEYPTLFFSCVTRQVRKPPLSWTRLTRITCCFQN